MSEDKKREFKKPAMIAKDVVVEGIVKFSNLLEGQKPKGYDEAKASFNLTLVIEEGSATADLIEQMHAKGVEMEMALVPVAKKRSMTPLAAPLKTDVDKNGIDTGKLRLNLKKAAEKKDGTLLLPPEVLDAENRLVKRKFIAAGSKVQAQIRIESYVMGNAIGTSLKLVRVKILEEVIFEGTGGEFVEKSVFGAPVDQESIEESVL